MGKLSQKSMHKEAKCTKMETLEQGQSLPSSTRLAEDSKHSYSLATLAALFIIMSVLGWLFELSLYYINDAALINPGVLHGPWTPIYGVSSVLVLVLLQRFRRNPVLTFLLIVTLCGTVELFTGYLLESITGNRWWDYSASAFNLNGYICLEALLLFGLAGILFIYVLAPSVEKSLSQISRHTTAVVLSVAFAIFVLDVAYSAVSPNYAAVEQNLAVATNSAEAAAEAGEQREPN